MSRKRKLQISAGLVVMSAGIIFFWSVCSLPPIPPHRGDGQFQDLSHRAGPFPLRGYNISMPDFDLGSPQRAEYRFAGLSNIGQHCGVYLAIRDEHRRWQGWADRKELDGGLSIELVDSQRKEVVRVSGRLGEFIWYGFDKVHALYKMDKSFFTPRTDEEYRLLFSYQPDAKLAGYKGYVYLECKQSM